MEDITGKGVLGHRAPIFSIQTNMTWAFEELLKCEFKYDSRVFPSKAKVWGDLSTGLEPFEVKVSNVMLYEIPPAVLDLMVMRLPVCGGGYLGHFPYSLNAGVLRK